MLPIPKENRSKEARSGRGHLRAAEAEFFKRLPEKKDAHARFFIPCSDQGKPFSVPFAPK
ncbi:MAG: hypothetical protein C6P37_03115 [Caldibacillus debilis]|uniref:Uncharacterized protein n=1 Tax=Caldibacillus debilis TaxID=301148 RepID=A0A3E0K7B0_9BACI|nr:hypothetical protein [Bacillaceae bacterium]REJ30452.1 MAG: hypothetical protein C6P37_03115 [Caldibacillus debilis]